MSAGTVLIADDHAPTRSVLRDLLQRDGWKVHEARNGRELVELAATNVPDAVVTDLAMPGMDGVRAARELRRRPEMGGLRLVAITAQVLTTDQRRRLEDLFDLLITKPVRPGELRAALASR